MECTENMFPLELYREQVWTPVLSPFSPCKKNPKGGCLNTPPAAIRACFYLLIFQRHQSTVLELPSLRVWTASVFTPNPLSTNMLNFHTHTSFRNLKWNYKIEGKILERKKVIYFSNFQLNTSFQLVAMWNVHGTGKIYLPLGATGFAKKYYWLYKKLNRPVWTAIMLVLYIIANV